MTAPQIARASAVQLEQRQQYLAQLMDTEWEFLVEAEFDTITKELKRRQAAAP